MHVMTSSRSRQQRQRGREECRAHDLLCADHFSEEAKIEHLPGKTTVGISEGGGLGEHKYVSSNDEGVAGLEEEGGGGGRKIAPAVGALLGQESVQESRPSDLAGSVGWTLKHTTNPKIPSPLAPALAPPPLCRGW